MALITIQEYIEDTISDSRISLQYVRRSEYHPWYKS